MTTADYDLDASLLMQVIYSFFQHDSKLSKHVSWCWQLHVLSKLT